MNRKSLLLGLLALTVVVLFGLWLAGAIAYPPKNPLQRYAGVILSPQADQILRTSCFDCHSNETRYPWYYRLPVASLVMGFNIHEGRGELNFSLWDTYAPRRQRRKMQESLEQIRKGEMPDPAYLLLHAEARLSPSQAATLEAAAVQLFGPEILQPPRKRGEERRGRGGEDDDDDDRNRSRKNQD